MARKKNRSLIVLFIDEEDRVDMLGTMYPKTTIAEYLEEMQGVLRAEMMLRMKHKEEHILPKKAVVIEIVDGSVHRTIEIDRPDPIFFKHLVKEQLR